MIRSPISADAPKRQIVFVASLISFTVIPGYAGYAPSKAALRMLADTLREECVLYDIDVRCCFPANILTPGFQVEEQTKPDITRKIEGTAASETPEAVAKKVIDRLERGYKHITYQFEGDLVKVLCPIVIADYRT
jgi:3-dehydrosphinganine reductase